MAQIGDDWNSFMQTKTVRMAMYAIPVFFCVYYAIDSVLEMMSPERSANMINMMGAPGYYAMTIIRCVVLAATGIAFGRMAYKTMSEEDE